MYVPYYLPDIQLSYPVHYGDTIIRVPMPPYLSGLAPGDWTYLRLEQNGHVEVVKVIAVLPANVLLVVRAQDNTEQRSYYPGAVLGCVDTAAAIIDAYVPVPLVLHADGAISIENNKVSYPMLNIATLGASEIVGSGGEIVIARDEQAYGCCGGDNDPAPLPPPPVGPMCFDRAAGKRFYGYVQINESGTTAYKYGMGSYNPILNQVGDVATANMTEQGTSNYYGDICTDGRYVYSFTTEDDSVGSEGMGTFAGLYAFRVNLGSEELERIATYRPAQINGGELSYWSIQDVICGGGKIFISLYEYTSEGYGTYTQVLTFNGSSFVLEATILDPEGGDYYEYCNGHLIVLDYGGAGYTRMVAYKYEAGALTLVDSLDLGQDPSNNTDNYASPFFIDGTHIYLNNLAGVSGPSIYNFTGTAFVPLIAQGVMPDSSVRVTGGDGLMITTEVAAGYLTTVKVRKWDSATPTAVLQEIPCFEDAAICYDPVDKRLYVPGYNTSAADGELDHSGVYQWNEDTQQFDTLTQPFFITMMFGGGWGFTYNLRMLNITLEHEVCDVPHNLYYAYILSNGGYEEYTKETKIAYAKLDTLTGKYTDVATHYNRGTKVYTTGGVASHGGYLFACTGSVFGYAVPPAQLDKPALLVMKPHIDTGALEVITRYEAPIVGSPTVNSWSISGPAIDGAGRIYVVCNDDQGSGPLVSILKAFTFDGTALIELGSFTLATGAWDGTLVFLHGEFVMAMNNDILRAFSFDGTTFTQIATQAIVTSNSTTGDYNVKSDGSYIYVLSAGAGFNDTIYEFTGTAFNLLNSTPNAVGFLENLAVDEGVRFARKYPSNVVSDINPVWGGLYNIRRVEVRTFDGTTLSTTPHEAYNVVFSNIFYDPLTNILFSPIASGMQESGQLSINAASHVAPEGSGIYRLSGAEFTKIADRFALGHRINSSLDNANNSIMQLIVVPKLHS